jgi:O-antigen/teichoic acid export membrane protein
VAAVTLSQVTATLSNSVSLVAYPRACAAPSDAERARVIGLYLRATTALMVSSTIVLWIAAPVLLRLLFGQAFGEASPVVRLLVLGVVPLALKDFFVLAFKAFDKALSLSESEIVALALNAGLLWLLVPPFGLMGAAASFVIMRWLSLGYLAWLVKRDLKIKLVPLFRPTREDIDLARKVVAKVVARLRRD